MNLVTYAFVGFPFKYDGCTRGDALRLKDIVGVFADSIKHTDACLMSDFDSLSEPRFAGRVTV